jgi:hypothetical protein
MRTFLANVRRSLSEFFFALETPYGMACMRIMLPLVMFSMVLPRWPYTRELYSSDGATAPLAVGYGYFSLLPEFSGEVAVALHSILVLALCCVLVGYKTRWALVLSLVIYPYLSLLDAISTMTKYTVITTHLLLLLSCSNCGAIWSVDAWLRGGNDPLNMPKFAAWPRRLAQLLIGIVYFGAAITKMNTPTFLSGDQMQLWMLTHINFRHPIGEWLSLYPVLLKAMAYVVLVWEVTFVFLVWRGMWRPWVLAIGVVFHFMTTVTLGLFIFPMTCYSAYMAFIDEHDIPLLKRWLAGPLAYAHHALEALRHAVERLFGRPAGWGYAAHAVFPALMLATAGGGVGLEYWMDPYGVRRPEGRHQLQPLDPEFAQRLLAPTPKIRDQDKFFAIDTGSFLVGDLLGDRRKVFRQGETLIAQCHLVPPHEDMWIECKFLDGDNRLVDRIGNIATRDAFRLNFPYNITDATPPGDYTLVFETAGREVLRKRVTIVDNNPQANAN